MTYDTDTGLPAWQAILLSAVVALTIIAVSTIGLGAIAHLIHPDCSSVLECVRL